MRTTEIPLHCSHCGKPILGDYVLGGNYHRHPACEREVMRAAAVRQIRNPAHRERILCRIGEDLRGDGSFYR